MTRAAKLVDPRLAALAARRALRPGALVATALVALALATSDWGPGATVAEALDAELGSAARSSLVRAAARNAMWTGMAVWLLGLFVVRAARALGPHMDGELDWLAAQPVARLGTALSSWLGQLAALAAIALATAVVVELAVRESRPALKELRAAGPPSTSWITPTTSARWPVPHVESTSATFTFEVSVASGGPGMDLRVRAVNFDPTAETRQQRIVGRGEVEIDVPPGGEVLIRVGDSDRGASDVTGYLHPDSGRVWGPVDSVWLASTSLAARVVLAGAAWTALALGLGAWMRGSLAALLAGAAWLAAALWSGPLASFVPGAGLVHALEVVGRGRVPASLGLAPLAGAAICIALGLALAAAGLAPERRSAR